MEQRRDLAICVLGPTALAGHAGPVAIWSPSQRTILAVLVAAAGDSVTTDALIDAVWGDGLPTSPRAALQTQLSRLRSLLGDDAAALAHTSVGYALEFDRSQVDAWVFEDQVSAAVDAAPEHRAQWLGDALGLWHGVAFADAADHRLVQPVAVRLDQLAIRAREDRLEALLDNGVIGEAVATAEELVTGDPLRERAVALLMRALYEAGRSSAALARYQQHRHLLAEQLGLTPSPLLVQLEAAILRHEVDPHLGAASGDPAERSPPNRSGLPPLPVSTLIGRRSELADVTQQLADGRIVTITGPGGVGKTRLAMHVAHEVVEDYRGSGWWCDLATVVADGGDADVATAVASVLGVEPRGGHSISDRLVSVMEDRRALLVLDNCEHVLQATADLVDRLVRFAPALDVLVTSREPLAVDGEVRLRLDPLPVPIGDEVTDAVLLFLQRTRAIDAHATTDGDAWGAVMTICRTLDGLPLALEFAAARVAHMTIADVAGQLDHRFEVLEDQGHRRNDPRHASLEAALGWSYDLLTESDRRTLDAVALFAGPFTLDDAQRLCSRDATDEHEVVESVTGLVDKSLVSMRDGGGAARYRLLDSVRAFSLERLERAGDLERWRRHHASFTVELAERADAALRGPAEDEWRDVLDDHIGDLRAARAFLMSTGDLDGLARLCAGLGWFAEVRSRPELDTWLADAAHRVGPGQSTHRCLPRLYAMAASAAITRGNLDEAEKLAVTADEVSGARSGFGVEIQSRLALFRGELDSARRLGATAAARHQARGEHHAAVIASTNGVAALAFAGRTDEARRAADQLLAEAKTVGGISALAFCEYCAAEAFIDDADRARAHLERSIDLASRAGADFVRGLAITTLAGLDIRRAQSQVSFARLSDSLDHWERAGSWRQQWWVTLRILIEALSGAGHHRPVVVLSSAFEASATTGPAFGVDAKRLADAVRGATSALDSDDVTAATLEGAALDDETALTYGRRILAEALAGANTGARTDSEVPPAGSE